MISISLGVIGSMVMTNLLPSLRSVGQSVLQLSYGQALQRMDGWTCAKQNTPIHQYYLHGFEWGLKEMLKDYPSNLQYTSWKYSIVGMAVLVL